MGAPLPGPPPEQPRSRSACPSPISAACGFQVVSLRLRSPGSAGSYLWVHLLGNFYLRFAAFGPRRRSGNVPAPDWARFSRLWPGWDPRDQGAGLQALG